MRWNKRQAGIAALLVLWAVQASASDATRFVHKKKYVMGSVFEIVAYDASADRASAAIDEAIGEVTRLDRVMSNYLPDSELSHLNATAKHRPQVVSTDLYRVIEAALTYSRLSAGKFDITVGPLADLWKAALRGGQPPSKDEEAAARKCVGYEKVKLIPPNAIEFRSDCLQIDLGSVGKGYAVDRAAEILRKSGIRSALIDAGGSTIYAMGSPPGQQGWLVHMRDPSRQVDPTVMLQDASVSTSEQSPPSYLTTAAGHIIDPATGLPLRTHDAISVIAKDGTSSDALSTTLLLTGPDEGERIVARVAGVAAIWIGPDGKPHIASNGPKISMHPKNTKTVAGTN